MRPQERMGSEPVLEGTLDLRDYLEPLLRHKVLVVLTALVFMGLAVAFTFSRTSIYSSTSTVLVKPTGVNLTALGGLGTEKLVNLQTEAQLVESTVVAQAAAIEMGTDATASELLKHVSATPVPDSQTLDITFSDPDPAVARSGATAFANAYLANRRAQAEGLVNGQLKQITDGIQAAQTRLKTLNSIIANSPATSTESQNARSERTVVQAQMDGLQTQAAEVALLNTDPGNLIVDPQVPKRPSSPNHLFDVALGVLLGLAIGVGAGYLRSRTDQRLHRTSDIEGALGVPLLAAIPMVGDEHPGPEEVIAIQDPRAPASEAYRALRTTLLASLDRDEGVIMVVSSIPGEGKTTVAANLSVTLAYAGKTVVLVSADMRRPRAHELFGVPNLKGLSDYLSGHVGTDGCLVVNKQIRNLALCPAGPVPRDPVELLQSARMRDLLAELRRVADFVVLDCPPVLTVADSLTLSAVSDAAIFVVDSSGTKRSAVLESRRRLEQVGTQVLGGVLNKVPPAGRTGYTYGYGYGYGYGYAADEEAATEERDEPTELRIDSWQSAGRSPVAAVPEPDAEEGTASGSTTLSEPESEPSGSVSEAPQTPPQPEGNGVPGERTKAG